MHPREVTTEPEPNTVEPGKTAAERAAEQIQELLLLVRYEFARPQG